MNDASIRYWPRNPVLLSQLPPVLAKDWLMHDDPGARLYWLQHPLDQKLTDAVRERLEGFMADGYGGYNPDTLTGAVIHDGFKK